MNLFASAVLHTLIHRKWIEIPHIPGTLSALSSSLERYVMRWKKFSSSPALARKRRKLIVGNCLEGLEGFNGHEILYLAIPQPSTSPYLLWRGSLCPHNPHYRTLICLLNPLMNTNTLFPSFPAEQRQCDDEDDDGRTRA